ncbi:PTS sugar transporter subunit IIB [Lacticaseibacillus daqingensis]|uniref:PTS sugar transporter subunit IIB n=1 Tax=Lacticaseibacillus daqingensis TaxID=2486014 RepID=UPI000F79649C|nr:PTS sugar transporter subunit IIB [Lacticaseibacillus daqingensis]
MICSLRVDERLIHGQVAMTWTKELRLTGIVIANDEAAKDEMQKMTLKMALPHGVKLIVKSVEGAISLLSDSRAEAMRLMVITRTVADAVKVATAFPKTIELVNIGNAGKMSNTDEKKTMMTRAAMLTDAEIQSLRELVNVYPETFFRGTPEMEKTMASSALKSVSKGGKN